MVFLCKFHAVNFISDTGGDLNEELSRVVTELESAIHERKKHVEGEEPDVLDPALEGNEDDDVEEKALEVGGAYYVNVFLLFCTLSG